MLEQPMHPPDQTALAANHRRKNGAEQSCVLARECGQLSECHGLSKLGTTPLGERGCPFWISRAKTSGEAAGNRVDGNALHGGREGLLPRTCFKDLCHGPSFNGEQVKEPISAKGTNLQCRLEELRIVDARDLFQLA